MKKTLFTLFAASLLLTVACTKNDGTEVVFPEPATKAEAVSIAFDKGEDLKLELLERIKPSEPASAQASQPVDVKISTIELTEGNRYVLYIDEATSKVAAGKQFAKVWTGKYICEKGTQIYKLEKFGEIELGKGSDEGFILLRLDKDLSVKASGAEIKIAATITPITTIATVGANLSRTWKVASTHISVKGGKNEVNFSKGFTGCDLHEIGKYCKDMKVTLSDADLAALQGYKVQEMMLEGNNSIIITFDSKDPYYGSYTASGTSFSWSLNESNKMLSASATGTVGFPKNGQTDLVLNSTISAGNETYTGTFTFTLEQVN